MAIGAAAKRDRMGTGHAVFRLAHGRSYRRVFAAGGGCELGVRVAGRANVDGAAAAGIAGIRFLVEADPLPLPELVEALILDGRAVEEQVAVPAAVVRDEAESIVADGLDGAGR